MHTAAIVVWLVFPFWGRLIETPIVAVAMAATPGLLYAWAYRDEAIGFCVLALTWFCALLWTLTWTVGMFRYMGNPPPDYGAILIEQGQALLGPALGTIPFVPAGIRRMRERRHRWLVISLMLAIASVLALGIFLYLTLAILYRAPPQNW